MLLLNETYLWNSKYELFDQIFINLICDITKCVTFCLNLTSFKFGSYFGIRLIFFIQNFSNFYGLIL